MYTHIQGSLCGPGSATKFEDESSWKGDRKSEDESSWKGDRKCHRCSFWCDDFVLMTKGANKNVLIRPRRYLVLFEISGFAKCEFQTQNINILFIIISNKKYLIACKPSADLCEITPFALRVPAILLWNCRKSN
jgi:hypothetical protein